MKFELIEIDGKHFYQCGDKTLPSITTILGITNPYAGIRKAVLEDTSDIGTQFHAIVARLIEGDYIHEWYYLDKRIRNSVSAYDRFRKQIHYKPRRAETIVANLTDGYAGTEDNDGGIPDGHIIVEMKTGDILPIHYYQMAAQYKAHLKTFPKEKIVGGCLLHCDKETGYPHPYFISPMALDGYYPGFMGLKIVYDQVEKLKERRETWKLE